jgi:deoxyribonuclease V
MWPADAEALTREQRELAQARPEAWSPPPGRFRAGGCWVCFPRGHTGAGSAGDPAWGASGVVADGDVVDRFVTSGVAGAAYAPGLLALRVGRLSDLAVGGLTARPEVLLLDATGRDHPRGAGLAVQLGAELDMPTVGVTHRPLLAEGEWPADRRGAVSRLRIGDTVVACWVRTRQGVRPLVVHPGWRVDLAAAVDVVLRTTPRWRTPEPLRAARHLARLARDAASARRGV